MRHEKSWPTGRLSRNGQVLDTNTFAAPKREAVLKHIGAGHSILATARTTDASASSWTRDFCCRLPITEATAIVGGASINSDAPRSSCTITVLSARATCSQWSATFTRATTSGVAWTTPDAQYWSCSRRPSSRRRAAVIRTFTASKSLTACLSGRPSRTAR